MELALVNCNFLKKMKSISQHQIAFLINTPKFRFMVMLLLYTPLGLVWKEQLTGQLRGILQWLVCFFRTFPLLPYVLLTYFPVSHPLALVGKSRWALFAGCWGFIHLKFPWLFLCKGEHPQNMHLEQWLPRSTQGQHSTHLPLATALLHWK